MHTHRFGALALVTLLSVCTAVGAASPAPVMKGLWSVQRLTTFDPDPAPGATNWPGLNKPRTARYTICITEWRANNPMGTPEASDKLKPISSDEKGWQARSQEGSTQAEKTYRRLDARTFEGSYSVEISLASPDSTPRTLKMSMQYRAELVSRECGEVEPSSVSKFGEP